VINIKSVPLRYRNNLHVNRYLAPENSYNGFDSETIDGYPILLADAYGNYIFDKDNLKTIDMLNFLFEYAKDYNYFYNIQYDFFAILKSMLDEDYRKELSVFKKFKMLEYGRYSIFYIPHRIFTIEIKESEKHKYKKGGKQRKYFYEISKIFKGGLDKNAKEYLQDVKDNFDRTTIIKEKLNREEYVKDLIKYCIKDSLLTRNLALYFKKILKKSFPELELNSFYSPAVISEKYLINHLRKNKLFKKFYIPFKFNRLVLNAFYGGRFELIEKGIQDKCFNYDINSAYPYFINELKEIVKCDLKIGGEFNKNDIYLFYGIYRIKIKSQIKNNINPLSVREKVKGNGVNSVLLRNSNFIDEQEMYLTYYDMLLLKKQNVRYEIIEIFQAWHNDKKLFGFIENMYNERLKLKAKKDKMEMTYKIIMNSIFGKMLQTYTKYEITDYNKNKEYMQINDKLVGVNKIEKYGKLFQPLFSCYITSFTRWMVYDTCHNANVIQYATDGIFTKKKIKVPISKQLGDWSFKEYNDLKFIRTGFYYNDKTFKTRGIKKIKNEKDMDNIILKGKVKQLKLIPLFHYSKNKLNQLHTFHNEVKNLDYRTDLKRNFRDFEVRELLESQIKSHPYNLEKPIWYKPNLVLDYQKR